VAVGSHDAVRLPNGVAAGLSNLTEVAGPRVVVGDGRITLGPLSLDVVRWWEPRPLLAGVSPSDVAGAAVSLPATVGGVDHSLLENALMNLDARLLIEATCGLVGLGEGLTPVADDFLVSALATFRLVGEAAEAPACGELIDVVAPAITELAAIRTTALSASLIRHAMTGNVATPVASLLGALTGRGDVDQATAVLERVGHTSGPALVAGVGLGVRSVFEVIRSRGEEVAR
jgi:hypothetical protein